MNAVEKFLKILATDQTGDGSFRHLSSSQSDFLETKTYTSPFFTALILDCLNDVEHPHAQEIKEKAATFLHKQLSKTVSVNYWPRGSAEMEQHPYPDDLDDTMLTLSALHRYNPALLSTEQILASIALLTTLEVAPGGPYRTWLTNSHDPIWRDVDVAVNANVAYFLSLMNVKNPVLDRYLRQKVTQTAIESPYYPTRWSILFYLSRVVTRQSRTHLLNSALSTEPATLLDAALLVLTLINLKAPLTTIQPYASQIIHAFPNEVHPAPFCFDPTVEKVPYFAGSRAVTAAFCLAALARNAVYEQRLRQKNDRLAIEQRILRHVTKECKAISGQNRSELCKELRQLNRDYQSHRILLTTHDFEQALQQRPTINADAVIQLGGANLFGWYAYAVFDDIMDNNQGHNKLSLALRAHDVWRVKFESVFDDRDYREYMSQVLTKIHDALVFETQNLRFNYVVGTAIPINVDKPFPVHILADRAFGHVLGPMGLFYTMVEKDDKLFHELESFYHHFLITRQLLDDAHDWKEDFLKGQINSVTWELVRKLELTHIQQNTIETLHEYYWETYFPTMCQRMLEYTRLCSRSSSKFAKLIKPNYFSTLIDPLEIQINNSLRRHQQAKDLIKGDY